MWLWFAPVLAQVVLGTLPSEFPETPNSVTFEGKQLFVDGKPFFIKVVSGGGVAALLMMLFVLIMLL